MSDLTREAITYFESQKKRLEDFRKIYPSPNTVGYQATTKEISFYDMAISALSENKGFDGMTNGEVIQALFPNMTIAHKSSNGVLIVVENLDSPYPHEFYTEWWNAPYKGESEGTE